MITKLEDGTVVEVCLPLDGRVRTITEEELNKEFAENLSSGSMALDFLGMNDLIDAVLESIDEALKELDQPC